MPSAGFEPAIPVIRRPQTYNFDRKATGQSAAHSYSHALLLTDQSNGNFTHHIKKFYVVPTLRLCVLYGSQNKQQLLPYKTFIDWLL
jgi:hypothetical protein